MYKVLLITVLILMALSCEKKEGINDYPFFLGTYTDSESKGIYQSALNADGSFDSLFLAAETQNPSFLSFAHGKKVLLAVNELNIEGSGTLESYQVDSMQLKRVGQALSGGAHPCHLNVNRNGDVLIANYTGGNVGYAKVKEDGKLSALIDVRQHLENEMVEQTVQSHAHSIWYTDKENEAIAVDLGLDKLLVYQIRDDKLMVVDSLAMNTGTGPRHLAFHPHQPVIYVINELDNSIVLIKRLSDSTWDVLSSYSTLPDDYTGKSFCADIHLSPDGRFLYASNRGHNSIAIFKINDSGDEIERVAYESVKGDWPRHFALTSNGKFLVVANQRSNNLVAFKRNIETGELSFTDEIKADMPVCVLFK